MFGYVTPCKMELKMKDYEKFKAYYCGLCKSIKKNIGNIPRATLNYDMTFLAILLDSLEENKAFYAKQRCVVHPIRKKIVLKDNSPLSYAAFCNVILSYYKLIDNVNDDNSLKSKIFSLFFKGYLKNVPIHLENHLTYIENTLNTLYNIEKNPDGKSIDHISHPFAELTGFIISSYKDTPSKDNLYWLGYNLGKWIYIIDAWDDLEKDMLKNKFNAINSCFNKDNLAFKEFSSTMENKVDFILGTCASQCAYFLGKLPLKKNEELLYNILQYGLLEKMDKVFKRSCCDNEKSL